MKPTYYFFCLILLIATFVSCNEDDKGGASSSGSNTDFYVQYRVDNKNYTIKDSYGIGLTSYYIGETKMYGISGINLNLNTQSLVNQVGIAFTTLAEGSYNFTAGDYTANIAYIDGNTSNTYATFVDCPNSSGNLTIKSIDSYNIVEGTFWLDGYNDEDGDNCSTHKSVTNGKFRLKLEE